MLTLNRAHGCNPRSGDFRVAADRCEIRFGFGRLWFSRQGSLPPFHVSMGLHVVIVVSLYLPQSFRLRIHGIPFQRRPWKPANPPNPQLEGSTKLEPQDHDN
jgi:hypothetical protein